MHSQTPQDAGAIAFTAQRLMRALPAVFQARYLIPHAWPCQGSAPELQWMGGRWGCPNVMSGARDPRDWQCYLGTRKGRFEKATAAVGMERPPL